MEITQYLTTVRSKTTLILNTCRKRRCIFLRFLFFLVGEWLTLPQLIFFSFKTYLTAIRRKRREIRENRRSLLLRFSQMNRFLFFSLSKWTQAYPACGFPKISDRYP